MKIKIYHTPIKCNLINPDEPPDKYCYHPCCYYQSMHNQLCKHAYKGTHSLIIVDVQTVTYHSPDENGKWSLIIDDTEYNETTTILHKVIVDNEIIFESKLTEKSI